MKKLLVLICLLSIAAVAACQTTGENNKPANKCGGGGCSTKKAPVDVYKEYLDGKREAPNNVPVPGTLGVGQIWEVSFKKGDKTGKESLQVVHRIRRNLIIEHLTADGFVMAYEIDRSRKPEQGNVSRAWIGKKGDVPTEIKVGKGWAMPDASNWTSGSSEPFSDVEMGGKKWTGFVYTKGGSKAWVAERGYFNGIIKTTGGDKEWQLERADFHEKVKPFLKDWEAVQPAA